MRRRRARAGVPEGRATARARLARAAADGVLLDTEIRRAVPNMGGTSPLVGRRGGRVTVTARFIGMVNVGFGGTQTGGCYRFEVVPGRAPASVDPSVAVRELPYRDCLFR